MGGNMHVRFLGGKDAARRLPYPVAVPAFVATENELKLFLCVLCDLPVKKDSQGDRETGRKAREKKLNSVMAA